MTMNVITLGLALAAGLLSFISPCVLTLVPAYVGYITGLSAEELRYGRGATRHQAFVTSLGFVLGLAVIFTLLGATASVVGIFLLTYQQLLTRLAGVLIIVFGLQMVGLLRLNLLYREARLDFLAFRGQGYLGAFLMGGAFGIGWTPCVGAFLGSLLALVSQSTTVLEGMLLLFIYALGLGVPFIVTALAIHQSTSVMRWLKPHVRLIEVGGGLVLIGMGVLVFTGQLTLLSAWINNTFGTGLAL